MLTLLFYTTKYFFPLNCKNEDSCLYIGKMYLDKLIDCRQTYDPFSMEVRNKLSHESTDEITVTVNSTGLYLKLHLSSPIKFNPLSPIKINEFDEIALPLGDIKLFTKQTVLIGITTIQPQQITVMCKLYDIPIPNSTSADEVVDAIMMYGHAFRQVLELHGVCRIQGSVYT